MMWQAERHKELERTRMLREAHSPERFGRAVQMASGLCVLLTLVVGFWLGST